MKSLLALLFLIVSGLSFAQTATVVIVSPMRPVDCKTDNYSLVNWIYELKTMHENEDEAVVQFTSQYGQCVNGRAVPYAIENGAATAYAFQNGFVWPWQKEGVSTTLTNSSQTEVIVTLTFNKNVLFKKRPENHLSFFFEPGLEAPSQMYRDRYGNVMLYRARYKFPWNIDLYLEGDVESERSVRIRIR